ncbi:sigma-54-dependent Fis family transcriptional regulator [uncultured Jatrophihabitans sp.]|uniref:sigma-54-dependent Fis family transcriptional regulator n=1 Tax=uncultured Jatrophihabitans sp. TaxID=1610747 RepID=UPI0035C97F69
MEHGTARLVREAREQFLADGALNRRYASVVRPEILTSWRRSRLSGASNSVDSLPHGSEVNVGSALCRAAEPVLSRLAEQLSGLQAGVLIADRNARILRRWAPQTGILPMMDKISSDTGGSGSEEVVGTNGIGSIVEDRKPHLVCGAEHFADILTDFTCVGAPIFNPLSRKFEGVVTLNSDSTEASPLLTSLIASTAQEIESRLLDLSSRRERALLDAFMLAARAGRHVAVVGDDVLLAGPQASPTIRALDHRDIWERIREGVARTPRERTLVVMSDSGVASLTYTPVHLDDRLIGALLEVAPPLRVPSPRSAPSAPAAGVATLKFDRLPGSSPLWQSFLAHVSAQRTLGVPLLITGEPGVGKFEVARAVAGDRPIVTVDCLAAAGEPDWAGERDWARRLGAELPPNAVLVLRHADEVTGAGAAALSVRLDELAEVAGVRVIATVTPDADWSADAIRRRLRDQLGVVSLEVPPLRERPEDVADIVRLLVARHAEPVPLRFSTAALQALSRAPWPGNVRQLENVVRGLSAGSQSREITPELLPDGLGAFAKSRNLTKMEQLEVNAIMEMVAATHGNKVEMAKLLGISRSTLYRKMRHYRVDPDHVG